MATFTKKVEVVDARRFEGTLKSAKELVGWIDAHGGTAVWRQTQEVRHNGSKIENVVVSNMLSVYIDVIRNDRPVKEEAFVLTGTWVVIKQNGKIKVKTDDEILAEYDLK